MSDIFISYARADLEAARRLAGTLERQGWSVFWDRTIPAGKTWRDVIGAALSDARCVVVLWSQHSVTSHWVLEEADYGLRRRALIPALIESVQPPLGFGSIQAADLSTWAGNHEDVAIQQFLGDVAGVLGPAPVVTADERPEAETEARHKAEELQRQQAEAVAKREVEEERAQAGAESERNSEEQEPPAEAQTEGEAGENRGRAQPEPRRKAHEKRRPRAEVATRRKTEKQQRQQAEAASARTAEEGRAEAEEAKPGPPITSRVQLQLVRAASAVAGRGLIATAGVGRRLSNVPSQNKGVVVTAAGGAIAAAAAGAWFLLADLSGKPWRDCDECPSMVSLPGGTFTMGSPEDEEGRSSDEGPQREVTVQPFAIGQYEVTFDEWDACVAGGGCSHKPGDRGWGRGNRPVTNVSWNDAKEYVDWLEDRTGEPYRLPSEAEWEYAARAGTSTPFWTGAAISTEQANYNGNYTYGAGPEGEHREQTTPVDTFEANPWGLRDMHGNVWEWVEDCWHDSYEGSPQDGSAWLQGNCSRRVVRGGSWFSPPTDLRSTGRYRFEADIRDYDLGFRVSRMLTP